jgi:hypothetical protein
MELFNGRQSDTRLPDDCSFVPSLYFPVDQIADKIMGCLPADSSESDKVT